MSDERKTTCRTCGRPVGFGPDTCDAGPPFNNLVGRIDCYRAALALVTKERDAARATNRDLNRRCQQAEAAAKENVEACRRAGVSLGRGLGHFAAAMFERERGERRHVAEQCNRAVAAIEEERDAALAALAVGDRQLAEARGLLERAAAFMEPFAEDQTYGGFGGGDPRDFSPDPERSTEEERAQHKADCEAWERGERPTMETHALIDPSLPLGEQVAGKDLAVLNRDAEGKIVGGYTTRHGYGLGVQTWRDDDVSQWLAAYRAATVGGAK